MRAMDRRIGLGTATALVVASMIGTGVFTTTGFLVRDVGSPTAILFAWILGGVTAVCGALTYAELISALPTNGGEYALLGRMYHPALGFTAGFSSLVVGFAAPVAAASIAFGQYAAAVLPGLPPLLAAVGVLVLSSAFHAFHLAAGSRFQDVFTVGKVVLIVVFAGVGLALGEPSRAVAPAAVSFAEGTLSLPFAVGLIYVAFSYSGWNAAAYVAGEVESPERNLPRALILGTAIVTALYLALNVMFLGAAPLEALSGKVEIGHVAAEHLFGPAAARVVSAIIAVGLVSTIGAMVMTGARVAEALGRDHRRLGFLAGRSAGGAPTRAVLVQAALSLVMLTTSSFDALLTYTGFTLTLGLALTVVGLFVLRWREPELARPYRVTGYPLVPAVYAALSAWMTIGAVIERPVVAGWGAATVALGLVVWAAVRAPAPAG
jgi:APA family basic amino acid/polyamine antiporter